MHAQMIGFGCLYVLLLVADGGMIAFVKEQFSQVSTVA